MRLIICTLVRLYRHPWQGETSNTEKQHLRGTRRSGDQISHFYGLSCKEQMRDQTRRSAKTPAALHNSWLVCFLYCHAAHCSPTTGSNRSSSISFHNLGTKKWLQETLGDRQGNILPTTNKPDENAMKAPKRLATRYYQLKIGHAVIGTHLKRINTIHDDRCWWCNEGERQTIRHLLKFCPKWRRERETLSKSIKKNLWYYHDMAHMFEGKDSTEHILKFLQTTEVKNRLRKKRRESRGTKREMSWMAGWS